MQARHLLDEILKEVPEQLRGLRRLRITPHLQGTVFSIQVVYGLPNADDFSDDEVQKYAYQVDLNEPDSLQLAHDWIIATLSTVDASRWGD